MDNHSNGSSNDRWGNPNNGPQSSVKSFGSIQSVTGNDPWSSISSISKQQTPNTENWSRSMDHQNQDRYDRTYNERKSYLDGPVGSGNSSGGLSSSTRPSSFITNSRPQERYNSMSSRFDGRF